MCLMGFIFRLFCEFVELLELLIGEIERLLVLMMVFMFIGYCLVDNLVVDWFR